jgi:hypothetical protein
VLGTREAKMNQVAESVLMEPKSFFQPGPGSKYSLLSFRRELKKGVQGGFGSVHPRGME